jgi:hypothetical protein
MANNKWVCAECGWYGTHFLTAPSPFDPEHILIGCPSCKSVDTLRLACDEKDCWCEVTCGTPTADGYLRTCGMHVPTRDARVS